MMTYINQLKRVLWAFSHGIVPSLIAGIVLFGSFWLVGLLITGRIDGMFTYESSKGLPALIIIPSVFWAAINGVICLVLLVFCDEGAFDHERIVYVDRPVKGTVEERVREWPGL